MRLTIILYKLENLMIEQSSVYRKRIPALDPDASVTCRGRTLFPIALAQAAQCNDTHE
jgi:hypothetical protein